MIELHREGEVQVLRMLSGENRMNRAWLDAMNGALDEVEANPAVAALVTTGDGKFYSNGLDLEWLMRPDTEDMRDFVADAERLLARLLTLPLITVAACNGHTFAAGAMLALAHDFRVMRGDRGFFCLPEVDLGIPFTAGMDSLIERRLPVGVAHEVMVTGRRIGGEEAARMQVVHAAVSEAEVLPAAVELARSMGGKDRTTLGTIKRRMYETTAELLRSSPGTSVES
jgi:enoyl-CoA hydratase/carnithine racemase